MKKSNFVFNLEAPSFLNFGFQLKVWLRKLFSENLQKNSMMIAILELKISRKSYPHRLS